MVFAELKLALYVDKTYVGRTKTSLAACGYAVKMLYLLDSLIWMSITFRFIGNQVFVKSSVSGRKLIITCRPETFLRAENIKQKYHEKSRHLHPKTLKLRNSKTLKL